MSRRRTLVMEATKPSTPFRRSPRLHHHNTTQKSESHNNKVNSISDFSPTTSSCPRSRYSFRNNTKRGVDNNLPAKSFKGLNKCSGGSVNIGKSANGSLRKSRLDSKIDRSEDLRKSPRLCNKKMHSFEDAPITPVGMGERKSRCSELVKCSSSESKKKVVVQSGVGEVRARSRFQGKDCRSDSQKDICCGLTSSCGVQSERQHKTKARLSCLEVNVSNSGRMMTRSASKSMQQQDDSCRKIAEMRCSSTSRNVGRKAASKTTLNEVYEGSDSLKTLTSQPQKHITRSSAASRGSAENEKEICECTTQITFQLEQEASDGHPVCISLEEENKTQKQKLIGNKRKMNQAGIQGMEHGWTKEQEVALERAYFAAKPSPHFWKRVAKLVPGKSAQDCFDKVHSDNLTPLSTQRSSRAKKWDSPSDLSIPSCDLFKFPDTKNKKMRKTRQKSHIARRTVRHLLQKYSKVNQDNESDLFSILEPAVNPSVEFLQKDAIQSTPIGSPGKHKKYASRLRIASKSPLTSPPVLKKVKNMALHEKYIDQLHKREANRKVQSRYVKSVPCQPKDVITAAKNALVSNANDAISKFRDSQANITYSLSESEEEGLVDQDEDD